MQKNPCRPHITHFRPLCLLRWPPVEQLHTFHLLHCQKIKRKKYLQISSKVYNFLSLCLRPGFGLNCQNQNFLWPSAGLEYVRFVFYSLFLIKKKGRGNRESKRRKGLLFLGSFIGKLDAHYLFFIMTLFRWSIFYSFIYLFICLFLIYMTFKGAAGIILRLLTKYIYITLFKNSFSDKKDP